MVYLLPLGEDGPVRLKAHPMPLEGELVALGVLPGPELLTEEALVAGLAGLT